MSACPVRRCCNSSRCDRSGRSPCRRSTRTSSIIAVKRPRTYSCNFLDADVFAAADFNSYLMTCGGLPRLRELREQEFLRTPRGPGELKKGPCQTGRSRRPR